jgi:hypothetical protein
MTTNRNHPFRASEPGPRPSGPSTVLDEIRRDVERLQHDMRWLDSCHTARHRTLMGVLYVLAVMTASCLWALSRLAGAVL